MCPDSGRPTDKAKAREPVDDTAGEVRVIPLPTPTAPPPLKASRGGKRVVEPAATLSEGVGDTAVGLRAGDKSGPFTSAEKQKAYRERHKEKVREADRLRKAAKRQQTVDEEKA